MVKVDIYQQAKGGISRLSSFENIVIIDMYLMIKNAIAPIQAWLLSQGRCVGCGMPLSRATSKKHAKGTQVTCKCGRIYISNGKNFRRALLSEVK